MSEFEELYGDEFFLIDSNNLNLVHEKFYGYAFQNDGIVNEENFAITDGIGADGAYIWVHVTDENILITQDFMGSYGLYLYEDNNYFAISNSFIKLVEHLKDNHPISFNKNYADAFLFADLCSFSYNETLVNEIEELSRNSKIFIDKRSNQIFVEEIDYQEDTIPLDSEKGMEILDKWYTKWVNIFRKIKSETNNLIVELSGGFDSRIVAAIWLTAGIDLNKVFVRSYDSKTHTFKQDYEIASQIANEFNFKLNNDVVRSDKKYFFELETPLNLSSYLKLGFHKELHFRYTKLVNPIYVVTGSGGECIRWYYNKTPSEYSQYIVNHARKFDDNLSLASKMIVDSGLKSLKNKLNISEEYSKELPEKMYKEIRCRHHFGKAMVESYFFNEFTLTPLIDSELHKLKLKTDNCDDRNLLMALIYYRYCPKLLNFKFEGNREINLDTINYAKKINDKYPLRLKSKNLISGPKIENTFFEIKNNGNFIKYNEVDDLLNDIFNSRAFMLEFEKYYSPQIYQKILNVVKNEKRFPLKHAYAAFSILKIIHDTKFKSMNNKNLKTWLDSFLFSQNYEFKEDNSYTNSFDNNLVNLLLKYTTSRIDLINLGSEKNSIKVIDYDDSKLRIDFPKWFESNEGKGLCIQSFNRSLNLKILCINDGKLRLRLRGVDVRDKNGNRFPDRKSVV